MTVKLLTEHHLEFLSLKGDCRGSSESTHVKMPNCLKSCVMAPVTSIKESNCVILYFSCFTPDPEQRYTALQLLDHPFIKE